MKESIYKLTIIYYLAYMPFVETRLSQRYWLSEAQDTFSNSEEISQNCDLKYLHFMSLSLYKSFFFFFLIYVFILAALGHHCCAWACSSCIEQTSHCGGFSYCRVWALESIGSSSCGAWAQLSHNTWDLPATRIEPMSPALGGRVPTTGPPGKSLCH